MTTKATLPPINELQKFKQTNRKINYSLNYLFSDANIIDFDVYLDSLQRNLQRPFVWTLKQKQQIIMSILLEKRIPPFCFVLTVHPTFQKELIEVIDGKQRLMSMKMFLENEFPIVLNGNEYYFNDLPKEYQFHISTYKIDVYEEMIGVPTDELRIEWFLNVNYAGTEQETTHMEFLNDRLNTLTK